MSSAVESLPYVRGEILRTTADDVAKLRVAWRIVERHRAEGTLFNLSGLERGLVVEEGDLPIMDDDLAPAVVGERLVELGLDHLGGKPGRDDVFVANRLTAAAVAAMQILVEPGMRVVGVSPSYTHPAVVRAVRLAGGEFEDGGEPASADVVVVTRLAVTYDVMELDRLLFMPTGLPRYRTPAVASGAQRVEMLSLAVADEPRFEIDARELAPGASGYTVDTLRELRLELGAETPLWLLMGADQYGKLDSWHRPHDVRKLASIAVFARPGFRLTDAKVKTIPFEPMDISASQVRERVARGEDISALVPPAVANYVTRQGLYA